MSSVVDNIYSWSRLTPLDNVRVVILGQVRRPLPPVSSVHIF
jgi:uracil DNA glycosylase